ADTSYPCLYGLRFLLACFLCPAPAPPTICTLSLHDALPISGRLLLGDRAQVLHQASIRRVPGATVVLDDLLREEGRPQVADRHRSEEHTSELQSRENLVCRLLLEKKKTLKKKKLTLNHVTIQ